MMRYVFPALVAGLLLTGSAPAGEDGLTGYWKFNIFEGSQQISLWLLQIESKNGKLTASTEALKGAPKAKVDDAKLGDDTFTLKLRLVTGAPGQGEATFEFEGKLPKPGAKKILGAFVQGNSVIPAVLEATTAKTPFEIDRDLVLRSPADPRSLVAILDVIDRAKANKVSAKELQEWVESSLRSAELYGPRMQLSQHVRLLEALQGQKDYVTVAVDTARKISKQIDPKMPFDTQLQILTSVANVLRKGDVADEAIALDKRIEKLEDQAYVDYGKSALNYKTEKYPGRKAKSTRAVLVELFTGAQCPPCVAADMAFDGVEKTYGPGEVVLLQYHMHIPRPEPMSGPDSDSRFEFYAENYSKKVRGTPASLFNGKPDVGGGGFRDDAGDKYKEFCEAINKLLEQPATVKLSATAKRAGEKISIKAKVQELDKPGEKVRLRFVLIEDWVRFKGANGLQYHHRVVRAMPGGAKGSALKEKDSEHSASIDLGDLRKSLNKYLDEDYPSGQRPMRMRNLSVVAFVQNDDSTEVLQAINVPLQNE